MRKFLFLTLITILALTACAPAAAPVPTITPTDLPENATATPAPTVPPEPTEIPHPEGWEESWVVVEGYWMSPDMAAYVEKHDGHLEEIDGKNYFTTTVTIIIDDQTQDVKVKLLEESNNGEMIPSYETVRELLAENRVREVLELSRMKHAEDALFVVRSGKQLHDDLLRANDVIQGFVDRVIIENEGKVVWPIDGNKVGPSVFLDGKDDELIRSSTVLAFSISDIRTSSDNWDDSVVVGDSKINLMSPRQYLIVNVLGTDNIVFFIPGYNQVLHFAIDESVFDVSLKETRQYRSHNEYGYGSLSSMNSLFSLIDVLTNTSNNPLHVFNFETPYFYEGKDVFANLSEDMQVEWNGDPIVIQNALYQATGKSPIMMIDAYRGGDLEKAKETSSETIIWIQNYIGKR
jgi:hypothetical protein